ncbi:hypothetical protein Vadar_015402 [Vaccinium darrowii]|uniref:Uncharacterized protein n=1 Tax=Vaccinium darrowii TaxID=229202 RepID=A0ACB7XQX6_9ERIC|nr:hypothetical protein Vadar_015402 [Vaccinium darrowii]
MPGQRLWFHTFGFGFDELRNDYKVVSIMSIGDQPWAEVYSLNSGSWREISPKALRYTIAIGAPQAYLNGVAHWVATDYRKPRGDAKCSCIVTFSIKEEVFGEMNLPETRSMTLEVLVRLQRMTVLQESLSYIDIDADCYVPRFWVWVMKKYGVEDSWTLLFRVDTSDMVWPVGFRMNGEFVMEANRALISYDPESKQVKDLGIHGYDLLQCFDNFYVGKYVESLVLLDRRGRAVLTPEHSGTTDG